MSLYLYKTNSLLQLELIAFLSAVSEEMPEVEQANFFAQTARLKNLGEKFFALCKIGCHSPTLRQKYFPPESSRNHSYVVEGGGS